MNGTHPNSARVAAVVLFSISVGAIGCQTHPTAMTNPFASPDRVPPPATRTLLPGQAAPYYPGDPLPAMQGAAPGRPASWAAVGETQTPGARLAAASAVPPRRDAPAFASESSVKIPTDDDPLRALPPPQPTQLAAAPPRPTVSPALYNQPVAAAVAPNPAEFSSFGGASTTDSSNAQGLWRTPQIARQPTSPAISLAPPAPPSAIAITPSQNVISLAPSANASPPPTMGVRLRAVPSPAPQPGEVPAPRIRLPGYAPPQSASTSAGGIEQAAYYTPAVGASAASPTRPGGAVQTAAITPLSPGVFAPAATSVASASTGRDGFRPRGSMR